ncbi:lipopolysaccharide biosynthesis protein RfbH [bacterium]|nr:lipopolysaccharide biosynthesis protein RfbH [bacterium]
MNYKKRDLGKIEESIFKKITDYIKIVKESERFVPGKSRINYAGAVFDEKEITSMVDSLLKGWWGLGPKAREFSEKLSQYLGVSKTTLVNSGSSAILIALSALRSKKIRNPINKGEEVITPAVTFPTTLNPIIQNDLTPVMVDVDLGTYNVNIEKLKKAITDKTRAIILPHTLGNPNDMDAIQGIVEDNALYLIEDNCDALGSEFGGRKTGSFGILSTCSFYPAHHITMGEGGSISVAENNELLYRVVKSLRDWGRDCWCESDEKSPKGACGKRFDWEIDGIKYDHRYIYSHIGYSLRPTEIQAAMGLEQLKKIDDFNDRRRNNFKYLYHRLKPYENYLILLKKHRKTNTAWFAFPVLVRDDAPFSREDLVKHLEDNNIQTRPIFAGNITRQPAYKNCKLKVCGSLGNSDKIMKDAFFIGVYPGLKEPQLQYIAKTVDSFFEEKIT